MSVVQHILGGNDSRNGVIASENSEMVKMKGYLIPYKPDKCLAVGNGERIQGPILFVPDKGIIYYDASITGDCDGVGFVTTGADYFEDQETFLRVLQDQLEGKVMEGYEGAKYDLSEGVADVEISEQDFTNIADTARESYVALNKFRLDAVRLVLDLEAEIGRDKFYPF
ncbi:hypothetical protein HQ545_06265 [Candidatus Woesearchaeota archaeon]|nr:hypothetical protein [Candidatus Woesearchaeota archaeon]